jgi:hypothetical protein
VVVSATSILAPSSTRSAVARRLMKDDARSLNYEQSPPTSLPLSTLTLTERPRSLLSTSAQKDYDLSAGDHGGPVSRRLQLVRLGLRPSARRPRHQHRQEVESFHRPPVGIRPCCVQTGSQDSHARCQLSFDRLPTPILAHPVYRVYPINSFFSLVTGVLMIC